MTEPPLVAVIAICYNHARFAVECLDGIRSQTYKHLQIIIMDDCSQDDSVEIIRGWIERHGIDCKFVAHLKNQGICRTLNEALSYVNGKYIAIIATDDVWLPDRISTQIAEIEALPESVGVLYSDAYQIDENGHLLPGMFIETHVAFDVVPEGDIFPMLIRGNFIPAMSTLIRASVYAKVGCYDERLVYEDWDMWLRIARHYKFAHSAKVLTKYRVVATSLTRKVLRTRDSARFISDFLIAEKLLADQELTGQQRTMLRKRLAGCANSLYGIDYPHALSYLWKALKISADGKTMAPLLLAVCGIQYSSVRKWQSYLIWRWSGIKNWLRGSN